MKRYSKRFDRFGDLAWVADRGDIQVYNAFHMYRAVEVLLKIVQKPTCPSETDSRVEAQRRIFREALATDRVVHPNVVRVIDCGMGPDFEIFLALELLTGWDLAERLTVRGPMTVPRALEMGIRVARGVAAAHDRDVIHGDIKPSNIFLLAGGGIKLLDFGCATAPVLDSLRVPERVRGTPAYLCPHCAATGVPDERCDLYSLAVTLYEAISGTHPIVNDGRFQISESSLMLRMSARRAATPLRAVRPNVSHELSNEIIRAMAPNPDDRHRDIGEFLRVLERELARLDPVEVARSETLPRDDDETKPFSLCAAMRTLDEVAAARQPVAEASDTRSPSSERQEGSQPRFHPVSAPRDASTTPGIPGLGSGVADAGTWKDASEGGCARRLGAGAPEGRAMHPSGVRCCVSVVHPQPGTGSSRRRFAAQSMAQDQTVYGLPARSRTREAPIEPPRSSNDYQPWPILALFTRQRLACSVLSAGAKAVLGVCHRLRRFVVGGRS